MNTDAFECPICYEIADDAVETSCCHQLFCDKCLKCVETCPLCRKKFKVSPNFSIRRIIGTLKVNCEYCHEEYARSDLKHHVHLCPLRNDLLCNKSGCTFKGSKDAVINHFIACHINYILKDPRDDSSVPAGDDDLISIKRVSGSSRLARLGATGKYYCGGMLSSSHPRCCDGRCGVENGCNCVHCMQLDINSRKLPRNYYVNREGGIARRSSETNHFYCGRYVMSIDNYCDGYCGPNNGPQCRACEILEDTISIEYGHVKW